MTPENKYRVNRGLKIFSLFAWGILSIATVCVIWNANAGAAASILAGAELLANAVAIFLIGKSFKSPEIEDWHLENPVEAAKRNK